MSSYVVVPQYLYSTLDYNELKFFFIFFYFSENSLENFKSIDLDFSFLLHLTGFFLTLSDVNALKNTRKVIGLWFPCSVV